LESIENLKRTPVWSIAAPLVAQALLAAKLAHLVDMNDLALKSFAGALLIAAVFAAVRHAQAVAAKIGEPYGALVLALAVTCIEAGLIVSLMVVDPLQNQALARDSLFAVVMIVLNGLIGACLVIGDLRYRRVEFRLEGTSGALVTLATLAVLTLVLPNVTTGAPGPHFSTPQLIMVACAALVLYLIFVFVQSVRHPMDFLSEAHEPIGHEPIDIERGPGRAGLSWSRTFVNFGLMAVSLESVVLLAKSLTPALEKMVLAAELPTAVIGVCVAALVLLPEVLSALFAATRNQTQTSLNLAIGSALASIGLTVPVVSAASLMIGAPLVLGLDRLNTSLLLLTLFVSTITLGIGRATLLQGAVHLVIFVVFLGFTVFP
jgi:Ca2+:H+ antiporter